MQSSEAQKILDRIKSAYPNQTGFWNTTNDSYWFRWIIKQDYEVSQAALATMAEQFLDKPPSFPAFKRLIRQEQMNISRIAASAYDPSACDICGGKRFKEGFRPRTLIPCENCLPNTYRKWDEGHYKTNHFWGCKDCQKERSKGDDGTVTPAQPSKQNVLDPLSEARFTQWANHLKADHTGKTPEECPICTADEEVESETELVND